jgi:hypothetical protein
MRKLLRKNPYTFGVSLSLLAIGGVAVVVMRIPELRDRAREMRRSLVERFSAAAERPTFADALPIEHEITRGEA